MKKYEVKYNQVLKEIEKLKNDKYYVDYNYYVTQVTKKVRSITSKPNWNATQSNVDKVVKLNKEKQFIDICHAEVHSRLLLLRDTAEQLDSLIN